ncbi:hypothetical protein RR46_10430 [Papilio xuthus]|uniref:Uncharacterized protein n=1 Tax=Papilio xuthus TaxID=66420 RepID=A0A194PPW1_PAPXU|nr:hypothetical protein RR46_10430 [Papilio xuthus]
MGSIPTKLLCSSNASGRDHGHAFALVSDPVCVNCRGSSLSGGGSPQSKVMDSPTSITQGYCVASVGHRA